MATNLKSQIATTPDLREIEGFIHDEVRLLDDRKFEEWIELFAADGFYWAPTVPGQANPARTVSLFYDDRSAMKARFARLRHPRVHAQTPPSRTRHIVSGVRFERSDVPHEYSVSASFLMLEYRPGHEQRIFGGEYRYRLRRDAGKLLIAMKRAELINCDASFGLMAIPF